MKTKEFNIFKENFCKHAKLCREDDEWDLRCHEQTNVLSGIVGTM